MDMLMQIAANIPNTGDNFPKGILVVTIIVAVAGAVVTGIAAAFKNKKDNGDNDT